MSKKIDLTINLMPLSIIGKNYLPRIFRIDIKLPDIPRVGETVALSFRTKDDKKAKAFFRVNDVVHYPNHKTIVHCDKIAKTEKSYEINSQNLESIEKQYNPGRQNDTK